jgi:hypothetical protein
LLEHGRAAHSIGVPSPEVNSFMNEQSTSAVVHVDAANLERHVNRLAAERGALFDRAGSNFGLSTIEQQRLAAVEGELDECFLARRQLRASRDADRFDRENPLLGRVSRRGTRS